MTTARPLCQGHVLETPPLADYQVTINDGTVVGFKVPYCASCAAWAVEFGHARSLVEWVAIWGSIPEIMERTREIVAP